MHSASSICSSLFCIPYLHTKYLRNIIHWHYPGALRKMVVDEVILPSIPNAPSMVVRFVSLIKLAFGNTKMCGKEWGIGMFDVENHLNLGCLHNQCHHNHPAGVWRLFHWPAFFDSVRMMALVSSLHGGSSLGFIQPASWTGPCHEEVNLHTTD